MDEQYWQSGIWKSDSHFRKLRFVILRMLIFLLHVFMECLVLSAFRKSQILDLTWSKAVPVPECFSLALQLRIYSCQQLKVSYLFILKNTISVWNVSNKRLTSSALDFPRQSVCRIYSCLLWSSSSLHSLNFACMCVCMCGGGGGDQMDQNLVLVS
jgi:hypothetical protein